MTTAKHPNTERPGHAPGPLPWACAGGSETRSEAPWQRYNGRRIFWSYGAHIGVENWRFERK
jgi:hypothetical protein